MSHRYAPNPAETLLSVDQRAEAQLVWKGLLSLAATLALAWARQRWWV